MTAQEALQEKLSQLYGSEAAQALTDDLRPLLQPIATQAEAHTLSEADVILICYGDHIRAADQTPLQALRRFLENLVEGTINSVHLLPFFPYSSDDGFSVIDYYAVNESYGTWDDIEALRGDFRLMFDFVCNHISAHSDWFQRYLAAEAPYDDYFIAVPPETDLSQVVRPRALPLLSPVETANGTRHVWTTFSADQVDLNYANPALMLEMLRVLRFYVERGAALIRLDAVAFLWKEIGTNCIHLPQTHLAIQLMRDYLNIIAPDTVLITETNVPHEENISYFGDGHNEAQMVYQFPLPPLVLHTLATGNTHALTHWAASLDAPAGENAFFNFTASHDGIGMRPATGLLSTDEIQALVERAQAHGGRVSYKTNSDGSQSPYELNITYFDAITDPAQTAEDPQTAVARFIVSQAIALALQGVPGIYLPSLFGSRNWREGVQQTGHNRTVNRQKFDYETLAAQLQSSDTLAAQVYERYQALLKVRTTEPCFHPMALQVIHDWSEALFVVERHAQDAGRLLAIHNVTGEPQEATLPDGQWTHLLKLKSVSGTYTLADYEVAWLKLDKAAQ